MRKSFANIDEAKYAAAREFIQKIDLLTRGKRYGPLVWRIEQNQVVFDSDMAIRNAVRQIAPNGYHYDGISLPIGHFGSGVIIHADFIDSYIASRVWGLDHPLI